MAHAKEYKAVAAIDTIQTHYKNFATHLESSAAVGRSLSTTALQYNSESGHSYPIRFCDDREQALTAINVEHDLSERCQNARLYLSDPHF